MTRLHEKIAFAVTLTSVAMGCGRPETEPTERVKGIKEQNSVTDDFTQSDLEKAFKVAFKGDARVEIDSQTVRFEPKRLVKVGSRFALISEGYNLCDAHDCVGYLAVHYLQQKSNGFEVHGSDYRAPAGFGFGEPGEWSISSTLLSWPVLYIESGFAQSGMVTQSASILPLLPAGVGAETSFPIGYTEGLGTEESCGFNGSIIDVVRDESFAVSYTYESQPSRNLVIDYKWDGASFGASTASELDPWSC